ncbi:MAG: glycosyltransferase family 39 protein [Candidatus Omnitrophota bacterium]
MINQLKQKKNNSELLVFTVILACGFFMRLFSLINSDNFHGIAAGKIFEARYLLKHPEELWAWIVPAHGPVHLYLIAILFKIFGDYIIIARLISLFSGVALFFPYYKLIKLSFSRDIALFSCFIAAFFYLHVIYSVISTAESIFILFLFSGLYFYFKYFQSQRVFELIISALCVGVSSMCRFEGGLYIVLLSAFLIKKPKIMLIFLISSCMLPWVWIVFNFILYGDFFYFLTSSDNIVKYEFDNLKVYGTQYTITERILYWPMVLKGYFGNILFIFGIIGLWSNFRNAKTKLLLVLFLSILGFFIFKTFYKELAMQPRYGLSLGCLFIPFIADALLTGYTRVKKISKNLILARDQFKMLFFLILFYIVIRGSYLSLVQLPHTPLWVEKTAKFLAANVDENKNELVYIDSDDDNFIEPIKILSGLDVDSFVDMQAEGTHKELIESASLKNIKYRILISKTRNLNLKQIFQASDCKIYKIK